MAAAKVLVVEDDAHIRRLLRVALERSGYAVAEAATAREGLSLVDIDKPEAVLLDLGLPDRDGLELIQLIKARSPATVLVVSARDSTTEKVAALDLGADDYLTKPFDTEELLARLRTAFRHRLSSEAERAIVVAGDVEVDLEHRRVRRAGEDVHLPPKEYDVLAELAKRPDRVIGHAQLLRTVWGPAQEAHVDYLRIVSAVCAKSSNPTRHAPGYSSTSPASAIDWRRAEFDIYNGREARAASNDWSFRGAIGNAHLTQFWVPTAARIQIETQHRWHTPTSVFPPSIMGVVRRNITSYHALRCRTEVPRSSPPNHDRVQPSRRCPRWVRATIRSIGRWSKSSRAASIAALSRC